MQKTALVCGAGGFIGGHLSNKLKKEGFWVRSVDLKHNEHQGLLVDDFVIGDLRDPIVCKNILDRPFDEVYQLAADMLVAASGDIAVGNPPPGQRGWKVGIATFGGSTNTPSCALLLHNAGISTSGDTEQFIEINGVHYSHIVNPATGLGLTNRIQATIIAPDATTTDSLDTTVSLLGVQRGLALIESWPHLAALIVTIEDGQPHTFPSSRFKRIPQPH